MTAAEIITVLEEKFGSRNNGKKHDSLDPYVVIEPRDLLEMIGFLSYNLRMRFEVLNSISGVDYLESDPKKAPKAGFKPHLELVYHFSSYTHWHRLVVKLLVPRWQDNKPGALPEVPSVTGLWQGANWHEREVYDLSGVW